ncbi:MAG: hypothetical protein M0Z67_05630 [Nitrospiraceae bacterium]|nr:hypothetical protein [Nitrospiraceae bacterium]
MRYFCTYFDSRYLLKGLALYRSLIRHAGSFQLFVLCLDTTVHRVLESMLLPGVRLVLMDDFERGDDQLVGAKRNRSRVEYYFTCTPSLMRYVFKTFSDVDLITYLDADLFFFSNLESVDREFGDNSILIIGHRFPPALKHMEKNGIFNVGYVSIRRDQAGFTCLESWRNQCLLWCRDVSDGERYADQKYLDDWPARFSGVRVLKQKGADVAPWNLANYLDSLRVHDGQVYIDEDPLVFYHFHGLEKTTACLYDSGLRAYGASMEKVVKRYIYAPYFLELDDVARSLGDCRGESRFANPVTTRYQQNLLRKLFAITIFKVWLLRDVLRGRFLYIKGNLIV